MNTVTISNLGELPYAIEEAVNRLRINIGFMGENVRRIMITSTYPNEGKSMVSLNLWRQMASSGVKTAFVDLDMRNSVLSQKYPLTLNGEGKLLGTTDYLAGKAKFEDVICHTQYEQGDIIINQENIINPSQLLGSDRFTEMMEEKLSDYRYVFIDTPPLDLVSDGEAIGAACDGAILVIRSGSTPTGAVRSSIAQLERSGCPVLGVVLSRAETSKTGYYGKRYGGSYYGGKDGAYYYGSK